MKLVSQMRDGVPRWLCDATCTHSSTGSCARTPRCRRVRFDDRMWLSSEHALSMLLIAELLGKRDVFAIELRARALAAARSRQSLEE